MIAPDTLPSVDLLPVSSVRPIVVVDTGTRPRQLKQGSHSDEQ